MDFVCKNELIYEKTGRRSLRVFNNSRFVNNLFQRPNNRIFNAVAALCSDGVFAFAECYFAENENMILAVSAVLFCFYFIAVKVKSDRVGVGINFYICFWICSFRKPS